MKALKLLLISLIIGFSLAQTEAVQQSTKTTDSTVSQGDVDSVANATKIDSDTDTVLMPEKVADLAIAAWLKKKTPDFRTLALKSPEEVCAILPDLVKSPPPPKGTTVNIDDRHSLETQDPNIRLFTYPSSLGGTRPEIIEVRVVKENNEWRADQVSVKVDLPNAGFRKWLQTRLASWLFIAFSIFIFYSLAVPSYLRKWLALAWANILEHRRIVSLTVGFLGGVFALGVLTGSGMPAACKESVHEVLLHLVGSVGATEAYTSGSIPRAATITFYQNFGSVTMMVLYGSALLFGFPAYFIATASFFIQGIPFGLLASAQPLDLLISLIVLVLELSAYFLVVAGGGIFLATLIRKGFKGFSEGLNKLTLMLPVALVLLLIGAWFEAFVIIIRG